MKKSTKGEQGDNQNEMDIEAATKALHSSQFLVKELQELMSTNTPFLSDLALQDLESAVKIETHLKRILQGLQQETTKTTPAPIKKPQLKNSVSEMDVSDWIEKYQPKVNKIHSAMILADDEFGLAKRLFDPENEDAMSFVREVLNGEQKGLDERNVWTMCREEATDEDDDETYRIEAGDTETGERIGYLIAKKKGAADTEYDISF